MGQRQRRRGRRNRAERRRSRHAPRERWAEREIAKFLTRLPHLRSVDSSTLTDLRSERDALDQQCHILDGLADVARISVSPRDKRR